MREQPNFVRGEFKFDYDATDMANQYTAVIRVNSTTQAGTGMGKVALGICPPGKRAFGIVQMNGAKGEAANVMVIGVTGAKISVNAAPGKADDMLAVGFAVAQADEDYNPGEIPAVTVFPFGKQ